MTFVIGFHCFNGLVLCADSEEADGMTKTYTDKLYGWKVSDNLDIYFGGAGNAVSIDKFRSKLRPILANGPVEDEITAEARIEKTIEYMDKQYRGSTFDILLAMSKPRSDATFLYRTYEGERTLRPIEWGTFACIGMDTSVAHFLLTAMFDPLMGIRECLRLGLLVTAYMKRHADGVSGPSVALSYNRNDATWQRYYSHEISEIEHKYPLTELEGLLRKY